MKTRLLLRQLAVAALFIAASFNTQAQQWEAYPQGDFYPVDVAAHPDGSVAYTITQSPSYSIRRGDFGGTVWKEIARPQGMIGPDAIAVAPNDRVYLAGGRLLADGVTRAAQFWASDDQGNSWSELLNLPRKIFDVAVNHSGNVFMISASQVGNTAQYPIYRLSTYRGTPDPAAPTGMNWVLVDDFSPTAYNANFGSTVSVRRSTDPAQLSEIWVAGYTMNAKNLSGHLPIIRRSLDGGNTWQSAAAWTVPSGYSFESGSWRVVAAVDGNGVAYATANYGRKNGKNTDEYWLTYRSANGGASWTLVNTFLVPPRMYGPNGIAADAYNRIFVTGSGLTRATTDQGGTWQSIAGLAGASCVTADSIGSVFIGGYSTEGFIYKLPAPMP